tara:strand:- start:1852 stop:2562 length:711 start_codon:yes stop_codon:yes gene_type:complete
MDLVNVSSKVIFLQIPSEIWYHLDSSKTMKYFYLGRQPYDPVWDLQKELHARRVSGGIGNIVLFVEHDHVYTFGKNANSNFLLDSKPDDADVIQIDRGGQVTYHGPGQLVCYPILDLHDYKMSVSWYMRSLECVVIESMKKNGVIGERKHDLTGVWIEDEKICAMGVRLSKWVTMHGFAFNVNPDLKYFDGMIPCGIFEYGITSFKEQGIDIEMEVFMEQVIDSFNDIFERNLHEV